MVRAHIANEARAQLARHRMSVSEAARRLNWGQTVLHRRVMGELAFQADELALLARLLEVPIAQFFPDDIRDPAGQGTVVRRINSAGSTGLVVQLRSQVGPSALRDAA